ncbi:TrlF family AAA-like ATPase [Sulfurimonas sp.]|uniref:TrlF family AAA-like ATPase n=1 Tax=Sulfurimonas sp. TaxID=2022749 RepID=UPI001A08365B|nr:hypothetical protein [Sulfurimonas sp.]MBE0513645.1 AAA family ATPase [Sulfurimonas sp.]
MNNSNRGSEWRKWDLHVHTKDTNKNDQFSSKTFDEFCIDFFKKAVENEIAVIGITDYFSIENYKKVQNFMQRLNTFQELKEIKEDIEKIYLIPNVEFRMLPSTDKGRLINIHCIFNPEYVSELDNDFFGTLEYSSGSRKHKMNDNGFIALGKELGETDENRALKKGIDSFVVSHSDLQKLRDENNDFRSNTIIVVSNSNQDGASAIQKHYDLFENESGSLDATRQAIYKLSNMIFSSNENDKKFFLGLKEGVNKESVIQKCGSLKPCIHGSDAHKEDKLFKPDNNRYCWIKANPTFEGLKQVIYEPSRVYIGVNKPQEALHKIENLKLEFDSNAKWDNDTFCFANFKNIINFSPFLTCIIGGRGSGKSTLLNLIAEKIDKADKFFFDKLNPKEVKSNVIFTPDEIENIEFLAQNSIEEFAKDSKKFTEAIYQRLDKNANKELSNIEKKITENLEIFDDQIKLLEDRRSYHNHLIEKAKELKKYENIVKTLTDKTYLENKDALQSNHKQILELQNSRNKYNELYKKLKNVYDEYRKVEKLQNNYDDYFNELYLNIESLITKCNAVDYSKDEQLIEDLEKQKSTYLKNIEEYLKSKGMNDENIKDAQSASSNIENVKDEISKLKMQINKLRKQRHKFTIDDIDAEIEKFRSKVNYKLEEINQLFINIARKNEEDVKVIRVEYQLNENIFDTMFEQFVNQMNHYKINISEKTTFKNYLQDITLEEVLKCKKSKNFTEKINTRNSQTYQNLISIFSEELYFQIYKLLIMKNMRDVENNKILKVFYDSKPLDNTSFGQRCTAAIVILISLGNNPIIIDEPEAHLDSSLIANYLVDLIKEKKQQRQIIFATHNANFVLNADAELIIKLENNEGSTEAKSFTIEDHNYREDLLKLEGGKEAFQKREKKYGISK